MDVGQWIIVQRFFKIDSVKIAHFPSIFREKVAGLREQGTLWISYHIAAVKLHQVFFDQHRFSRTAATDNNYIFIAVMLIVFGLSHTDLLSGRQDNILVRIFAPKWCAVPSAAPLGRSVLNPIHSLRGRKTVQIHKPYHTKSARPGQ